MMRFPDCWSASYYTRTNSFSYIYFTCVSRQNSLIDVAFGFATTPKKGGK